MHALKWITGEAKRLRKAYPRRFKTWAEYVSQASATYKSKHPNPVVKRVRKTKRIGSVKCGSPGNGKHTVLRRGAIVNLRFIQHPSADTFRDGSAIIRRIDKRNGLVAMSGTAALPGRVKRVHLAIPLSYLRRCGYTT